VNSEKVKTEVNKLGPKETVLHNEALEDGYKDEICPKCGIVFLAHFHFVNCEKIHCGECPMVAKDTKSLLHQILA